MVTTYFRNQIMGNVFGSETIPELPSEYYIGLSTTEPDKAGAGVSEPLHDSEYSRVHIDSFSIPTDGVIVNDDDVIFPRSSEDWNIITHFVIYDAKEKGNLLLFDELVKPRTVEDNTIMHIEPDSLEISLFDPSEKE